ncbi:MAG TPA: hypothetical protein ENJ18_04800 [Nannocystis exedens]|nr:hypothetical protein [Nannocystis exedens]
MRPSSSGEGDSPTRDSSSGSSSSGRSSSSSSQHRSPAETSAATAFEKSFFAGGDSFVDDPSSDSMIDGDPFAPLPSSRSIPTGPAIGGLALILLVVLVMLRGFGGDSSVESSVMPMALEAVDKTQAKAKETADKAAADKAAADKAAAAKAAPPPPIEDPEFDAKIAEARIAYDKHRLKTLSSILDELAPKQPNHPDLLMLQAQLYLERGDLKASMAAASKCVEIAASQADCWLTLGVLHQNDKNDADAIKAYETYLELAPKGRYARDATTQLGRLR